MPRITQGFVRATARVNNRVRQSQLFKWISDARRPMALLLVICLALPVALMMIGLERTASAQTVTFGGRVDFNTANTPTSTAYADFNGDGKQDIAAAGFGGFVSVLLNATTPGAPSPSFSSHVDFAVGTFPRCVVTGDFNRDGRPDLAVVNLSTNNVSVLLNTTSTGAATPTFATHVDFTVGTGPNYAAVGDINGDGKLDLVVANQSGDTISVLLNTTNPGSTTPTFNTPDSYNVGDGPDTVALVDINGDGKLDIAATTLFDNNVNVLLNTTTLGATTSTFSAISTFSTGTRPIGLTVGDFNNDGIPDLAAPNQSDNTVSVLINTTTPGAVSPSFAPQAVFSGVSQQFCIGSGDFNRDGKMDLIVPSNDGNDAMVLFNTSTPGAAVPSFVASARVATDFAPESVSVADFNGDGRPDFVIGSVTDNTISVLFNTTSVGVSVAFAPPTDFTVVNTVTTNLVATADFNRDGKQDMVVTQSNGFNGNNSAILLNTTAPGATTPTFGAPVVLGANGSGGGVAVGDFNGDGKPDVVLSDSANLTNTILMNTTAPGSMSPTFVTTTFPLIHAPINVVVADINIDGKPDLVISTASGTIWVRLNTTAPGATTATFNAPNFVTNYGTAEIVGLSVADINGDGKPEIISTDQSTSKFGVQFNSTVAGAPTASIGPPVTFTTAAGPFSVAVGDLNGDGRPDVAVADSGASVVSVFLNQTVGLAPLLFSAKTDITTGSNTTAVSIGDLTGDGVPDLVAGSTSGNSLVVATNTTAPGAVTPTFAAPVTLNSGPTHNGTAIADFNNDGKPDLAVTDFSTFNVSVWLNTSAGPATSLAITQVNGGTNPVLGNPFSVVVRSQDNQGNLFNVVANTGVSLSLKTGTGALSGTLTGTITAGTDSVTISGVIYNRTEGGVVITATRTSGDTLSAADSAPFTVDPTSVVYTDPAGVCGGQIACFTTIQSAINSVTNPGTVNVGAGTYVENPIVNKSLNLVGPNSGIAGSGVRGAESIVQTNGNQNAVFSITANNVTIDGLTIDGDDPGVTRAPLFSGDDANVLYGIRPSGAQNHITVKNNIVKHAFIGFRGDGASQNNLVDSNWFDNIGNFDFGYAVSLRTEYYADVTNNLMTRCWTGVHTNNFNAGGGPTTWTMSGNQIHSYSAGLFYSLQYNLATGLTVNNNSFSAEIGNVANNFGMLLSKVQNTVNPSFTNNSISGHDYGIGLFDVPTSNTITFGATNTISNARLAGVLLTDNLNFNPIGTTDFLAGGPGAASTVNINAMPITLTAKDGIKVDASGATPTSVNVTGANIAGSVGTNGVEVIGSLGSATLTNTQISVFSIGVSITDGSFTDGGGNNIGGGISMSGATAVFNLNGNSTSQGVTFSAGTINGNSSTLSVTGNWTNNGGTFNPGTGSVNFATSMTIANPGGPVTAKFTPQVFGGHTIGGSSPTTFNDLQINDSAGTLMNSDVSVTDQLTLTSGNLDAGSHTLTIGASGSISRTSGFVLGNLKKQTVSGSFSFPVGDTNGYMPLDIANAAGGGDFTVKAVAGTGPGLNPSSSLGDYWTLTATGSVTADLTFNYIAGDVNGDESLYRIIRIEGGTAVTFGNSVPGTSYDPVNHKASLANVSQFSDWTLGESVSPTAVNLNDFKAISDGGGVSLQWQTGFEVNNLGFNIYRQSGAERVQVNPSLIAGSALMVGADVRLQSGYTYTWQDDVNDRTASYWLEDVDLNGNSTWHGPFGVSMSQGRMITGARSTLLNNLSISAAQQANSVIVREYAADGAESGNATMRTTANGVNSQVVTNGRAATKGSSIPASLQKQWQIAQQSAIKIAINKTGWYKVNAVDLITAGLNPNNSPASLRMFVGGAELPIRVNSADGTHLDSIEFYGVGLDSATSDTQVYWLTSGLGAGKRINVQLSPGSGSGPSSFQYTVERKDRSLYFSSLRNGDSENWFGPVVATNPVSQGINIHNHDANAVGQAQIEIALQGVTTNAHQVTVSLNGQALNTTTFEGMDHHVLKLSVPESSLIEGNNQVTFSAQGSGDVSLIDYIRVTYAHTYNADNNVLSASVTGVQPVKITGFTSNQIRAIDVANANQPVELEGTIDGDSGNYSISVNGAKRRNLFAFTLDKILQPVSITASKPASLSNVNNGADFVIITSKDFAQSVQLLATLRQSQGYQVSVIDIDNVYDEFSYGVHSPYAVKAFLNWTYTHWQRQPQFVMLAGSGTLDPRNYTGVGFMDFVPTKLIDTASMETASDDWFVDFNNDGKPQMSIGRLPVHTAAEATIVVNKIIAYEQSGSTQGVALVSDLNDGIDFRSANNQVRMTIPSNLSVVNIVRGQTETDAKTALLNQLNQGGRIINYAGHGSVNLWRGGLLSDSDMTSLANHNASPLVVTMTCLNGYFQDPKLASLGESLLKVNNGGAVSVWASSGMTDSDNQNVMNREFFRQLFGNSSITIGQAIKAAKSATNDNDIRRTWILFGDPTMRIK